MNLDKTYCQFALICKNGYTCDKALTEEIKEYAESVDKPIWVYTDYPDCFVPWFEPGGDAC